MNKLVMALVLVLLGGNAFAQNPLKVYVFSAAAAGQGASGFIDRESKKSVDQQNDSVGDLQKALEGRKNIELVDDPAEARIKIAVDWRSEGWKGNLRFDFNSVRSNQGNPQCRGSPESSPGRTLSARGEFESAFLGRRLCYLR